MISTRSAQDRYLTLGFNSRVRHGCKTCRARVENYFILLGHSINQGFITEDLENYELL